MHRAAGLVEYRPHGDDAFAHLCDYGLDFTALQHGEQSFSAPQAVFRHLMLRRFFAVTHAEGQPRGAIIAAKG